MASLYVLYSTALTGTIPKYSKVSDSISFCISIIILGLVAYDMPRVYTLASQTSHYEVSRFAVGRHFFERGLSEVVPSTRYKGFGAHNSENPGEANGRS